MHDFPMPVHSETFVNSLQGVSTLKESKITPPLGPGICRPSCNGLHPESETNSKLTVCREWRDCK